MTRKITVGFLFLLFLPLASVAQTCSYDAIQSATENVKSIQSRLLAIKGDSDGMDYEVTPATATLISAMKDALAATITAYVQCLPGSAADTSVIETTLAGKLQANKPQPRFQLKSEMTAAEIEQVYGSHLQISVTKPNANLKLVAVIVRFEVGCGTDNILLLYEWNNGTWQPKLRWQSGEYKEVSGAFGDFFKFVVLPRERSGVWLLAVTHGTPWCTSRFSAYDLDLIQPAYDSVPQRVLVHKNAGYVRFEIEPTMKVVPGGFELHLETEQLDLDTMTRLGIYRYRLIDSTLQRVQPIALNGRDFVDEWLQSDWSDASRWSASANLTALHHVHAEVAKRIAPKSDDHTVLSYGPVRACTGDANHFQVEFDRAPGSPTFFQIQQGENSFTMLDASSTPDPRCKGANLMQKR